MIRVGLALVLAMVVSGCGLLRSVLVEPGVAIAGIRLGPGEGFYQTVFIDLMITNPGRRDLDLVALHYRVRLEGHELVRGTSRTPLHVAAGATERYTVPAGVNLLSGIGLAHDLFSRPRDAVRYELEATLEPESVFLQPITVRHADFVSLTTATP